MHPVRACSSSLLALLFAMAALPALAGSLAGSSAAGGSSASSAAGSASDSSQASSNSSSKDKATAEGPYRIIEVAAVPERPGTVRMRLQALADTGPDGEFMLYLPRQIFEQSRLASGETVTARARPYGLEFAHGATHQAFFLLLDDDWYRELAAHPVVL